MPNLFRLTTLNAGSATVAYSVTSSSAQLSLTQSGTDTFVAVKSGTAAGYYTTSGTDIAAGFAIGGTWTFTVHVIETLNQSTPTVQIVTEDSTVQSTPLAISNTGVTGVTYSLTSPPVAGISIDPAGTILTSSLTAPGIYPLTGTITDANGDTGSWAVDLQVKVVLAQASTNMTDTVAGGTAYSGHLVVPNVVGALTVNEAPTGQYLDITVSPTGVISAPSTLIPGVYTVVGHMSDDNGDQGSWTFTLTVTLAQNVAPAAAVAWGVGYSGAVGVANEAGTFAYTENASATSSQVVVDPSGNITASTSLPPGTYAVSGTMTESPVSINSGTWTFTLTVSSNGTINQSAVAQSFGAPLGLTSVGSITTDSSNTVTYVETSSPLSSLLVVDSSGNITVDPSLTPGVYTVVGTDYDTAGFSGTWVVTVSIEFPQTSPTSATVVDGAGYSSTLAFSGNAGAYNVGQFSPTYGITVDSSGNIVAPTSLSPGNYPLAGYAFDSIGNVSYWSFTLTVGSAPTPSPPAGVASTAFGPPTTGVVTPTSPTSVQLTSGSSTAAVTVPVGALPVGTAVDIYPVTNASSLTSSIPPGQSYVLSFAVSWQSPGAPCRRRLHHSR